MLSCSCFNFAQSYTSVFDSRAELGNRSYNRVSAGKADKVCISVPRGSQGFRGPRKGSRHHCGYRQSYAECSFWLTELPQGKSWVLQTIRHCCLSLAVVWALVVSTRRLLRLSRSFLPVLTCVVIQSTGRAHDRGWFRRSFRRRGARWEVKPTSPTYATLLPLTWWFLARKHRLWLRLQR